MTKEIVKAVPPGKQTALPSILGWEDLSMIPVVREKVIGGVNRSDIVEHTSTVWLVIKSSLPTEWHSGNQALVYTDYAIGFDRGLRSLSDLPDQLITPEELLTYARYVVTAFFVSRAEIIVNPPNTARDPDPMGRGLEKIFKSVWFRDGRMRGFTAALLHAFEPYGVVADPIKIKPFAWRLLGGQGEPPR